jgi:hypothetical protein
MSVVAASRRIVEAMREEARRLILEHASMTQEQIRPKFDCVIIAGHHSVLGQKRTVKVHAIHPYFPLPSLQVRAVDASAGGADQEGTHDSGELGSPRQ